MKLHHSTIEEIQATELKILDAFIDVCDEHKLSWFADSGTLLGAVREHGFISWDDDIDVCMPRDDFNELLKLAYDGKIFNNRLKLQTAVTDPAYFCVNAKIRLDGTTAITQRELHKKSNKGMFIDVYPIDSIPNNNAEANAQMNFVRAIGKYTDVEQEGRDVCSIDAFNCMNDVLTSITHKNASSRFVGFAIYYRYSSMQYAKFTRICYASALKLSFKGLKHKINIPIGYNEILSTWYGNYMIPSKASGTLHECFFDASTSYEEYDKDPDAIKQIEAYLNANAMNSDWQ